MNLENIMLSERSQSQKIAYCMAHSYEIFRIGKSIKTQSIDRLVFARVWGGSGVGCRDIAHGGWV